MEILITGGAGYIGSHVAYLLVDKGYKITIIDNLITGNKKLVPTKANFIKCDINNVKKINKLLKKKKFKAVLHFAGLIRVDESIKSPSKYINNNYYKSKIFIRTCIKNNLRNIIFSSTAGVYGDSKKKHVTENDKLKPLNPYAKSKLLIEKYIQKVAKKNNLRYIILRYFNVAGTEKKKRTGLLSKKSTNLIKIISEAASKKRKKIIINGNDYKTPDGTPVRDFIHVSDLVDIHIKSMQYIIKSNKSQIFNCGYGKGLSVLKMIKTANKLIGSKIHYEFGPRKKGDIQYSVSNSKKFIKFFKWKPKYNDINKILRSAIDWEKKLK
jgi:UDP-glucose 4-epimerase|tara:strand:- start:1076 stop:2050 length:975 start_codon:yes stop_codon:yes gene_type:complete